MSGSTNSFGQSSTSPSSTTHTSAFGGIVQQSQPLFVSSTPFGESSQSRFSASIHPLGSSTTSAFNATNRPVFGATNSPSNESVAIPSFRSTRNEFGVSSAAVIGPSNLAFEAASAPVFGASSASTHCTSSSSFGASSTLRFGTALAYGESLTAVGSSPFGTSPSTFGAQGSALGPQTYALTYGSQGVGLSAFGGERGGSRVTACTPTTGADCGSGAQPVGEAGSSSSVGVGQEIGSRGVSLIEIFSIVYLNVDEVVEPLQQKYQIILKDQKGYQILYKVELSSDISLPEVYTPIKYQDELLVNVRGPTSSFDEVVLISRLFDYGYTQADDEDIEFDYAHNAKIEVDKDMDDEVSYKECRIKSKDGMSDISVVYGMFVNGTVAQVKVDMFYCPSYSIVVDCSSNVYGLIAASNSKLDMEACTSLLFRKNLGDEIIIGHDGIISLSKAGVAVPMDSYLFVDISIHHGTVHHKDTLKFRSQATGPYVRRTPILHDGYGVKVTVNWTVDPESLLSFYEPPPRSSSEDDSSYDEDTSSSEDDDSFDEVDVPMIMTF